MDAQSQDFDAPTERMTSLTPLLYQSGYITIKGYDEMFDSYKLDIPNHEVELGLMRSLKVAVNFDSSTRTIKDWIVE